MRKPDNSSTVAGMKLTDPKTLSICAARRGILAAKALTKSEFVSKAFYLWWKWHGNTIVDSEAHRAMADKFFGVYQQLNEIRIRDVKLWKELSFQFLNNPLHVATAYMEQRLGSHSN